VAVSEIGEKPDRVYVGAQVDRDKRDQLVQFARESDQSVSQIIRRALAAELERGTEATT
jgi:predicted transcriptional regulator